MCECVYVDLIRVYYHFATESGKVTTTKRKITFFFFISLCLECQGCWGGAPRSGRLLWVWAGTGLRGLERFYQEKEDTTPVPNAERETKHALGTRSKWLMFHVTVIPLALEKI